MRIGKMYFGQTLHYSSVARSKKTSSFEDAFTVVTRIGFKPMTPNLEGLCSIQLSYRANNEFQEPFEPIGPFTGLQRKEN